MVAFISWDSSGQLGNVGVFIPYSTNAFLPNFICLLFLHDVFFSYYFFSRLSLYPPASGCLHTRRRLQIQIPSGTALSINFV